jgi:imidazolonepropionase
MAEDSTFLLIGPFRQLLPMTHLIERGQLSDEALLPIKEGGLLLHGELLYRVGEFDDLRQEAEALKATVVELAGDFVALPGFIDAHTHLCFAGSRARDYALRNAGKTYLEIAEAGGGIWDSVQQTRRASQTELACSTAQRANRHLQSGVTTIEVKSGYGLSVAEELKQLRAIKEAAKQTAADLVGTCLAAHTLPRDYAGTPEEYLAEMARQLLPQLKKEDLTNRVDAFLEQGAFSAEQIRPYFAEARRLGFQLTVHADQFSAFGSEVAVAVGALSADHLEASGEAEIQLLARSPVVAVALPGASLGLGCAFAPARRLLDAGASLAIASDWNPGSAPMGDLLTQAAILGTFEKLTAAEVLAGLTCRAAQALDLADRGRLATGLLADFILFPTANFEDILYQQGQLKPAQVWKRGRIAYSATPIL